MPSSPAPHMFPARMTRALQALRDSGWEPVLAPHARSVDGMSAASPAEIADDLHTLLRDASVDAVMAAAGGYTAIKVLPFIDYGLVRERNVPIIGYSDVATVLWAMAANGVESLIHGPMVVSEFGHFDGPFAVTEASLRAVLASAGELTLVPPAQWTDDDPWWDRDDRRLLELKPATPWRVLRHGHAEGPLIAGCLFAVTALLGTPYWPDMTGRVLFLEDFGSSPDRLVPALTQLRLSGQLDEIAGVVLGRRGRPQAAATGFTDFDAPVLSALEGLDVPVVADVDFGHTEPMLSLPIGSRVRITTDPIDIRLRERCG